MKVVIEDARREGDRLQSRLTSQMITMFFIYYLHDVNFMFLIA
jgi:hypothetical protein